MCFIASQREDSEGWWICFGRWGRGYEHDLAFILNLKLPNKFIKFIIQFTPFVPLIKRIYSAALEPVTFITDVLFFFNADNCVPVVQMKAKRSRSSIFCIWVTGNSFIFVHIDTKWHSTFPKGKMPGNTMSLDSLSGILRVGRWICLFIYLTFVQLVSSQPLEPV